MDVSEPMHLCPERIRDFLSMRYINLRLLTFTFTYLLTYLRTNPVPNSITKCQFSYGNLWTSSKIHVSTEKEATLKQKLRVRGW